MSSLRDSHELPLHKQRSRTVAPVRPIGYTVASNELQSDNYWPLMGVL